MQCPLPCSGSAVSHDNCCTPAQVEIMVHRPDAPPHPTQEKRQEMEEQHEAVAADLERVRAEHSTLTHVNTILEALLAWRDTTVGILQEQQQQQRQQGCQQQQQQQWQQDVSEG